MSDFKFNFDAGALERAVKQAANDGIRKLAADYQGLLDGLVSSHAGKPLAEVKAALQAGWQRLGGNLPDPELTQYAEYIKEGRRIEIRPQQI
ncbi:hypothetical protein AB0D10_45755 [Kitasatospora sp. NPDC048545]|uniref:hypothetical protein n=1 Tax=Kitasatospora sp. NPDC048545 TaxID=3157208 RepID=UPI0034110767